MHDSFTQKVEVYAKIEVYQESLESLSKIKPGPIFAKNCAKDLPRNNIQESAKLNLCQGICSKNYDMDHYPRALAKPDVCQGLCQGLCQESLPEKSS